MKNKYEIFILKASGKAIRYSGGTNLKNKMGAIEQMTSAWETEKAIKNNKAMYVADLFTGNVVQMAM